MVHIALRRRNAVEQLIWDAVTDFPSWNGAVLGMLPRRSLVVLNRNHITAQLLRLFCVHVAWGDGR